MKIKTILICLMLFSNGINFPVFSQDANSRKPNPGQPIFFTPKNHDPNFSGFKKGTTKSFYQSKSEWQHIIDTTWGPGDSLARKLLIFNTYAQAIHDKFDGFNSLQLNWDSLYNHYLGQITETTSKGAFSAIMSHFAYDLKDLHTAAIDASLLTPLNPGTPLLWIGGVIAFDHFGAVTTILPDSTTLVLRVVPNHPLDLEPGDIILGYEGVPWKILVRELLDAGLPMFATTGGCKTADTYHNLIGAGFNWHLFSTIDILKYRTGDTLHISVAPMQDLVAPIMPNNEQLPIKNIPFPKVLPPPANNDTTVTFGILEGKNIGYIYLSCHWPTSTADEQFYNAINALKSTDALIIDMRLNYGGWALFDKAFNILFNEYHRTIDYSDRCNSNTFELCPIVNWSIFQINGTAPDYFDKPIAVLLGPSCFSMGDITAQRLRYHPMVRFFGASPDGAFGDNFAITSFPNWILLGSISDAFHSSEPCVYLNRKEFPIDYPVWFNKDDVAKGIDPIVEKSLEWINNLAYGHNVTTEKAWYSAGSDTVTIDAVIENPNSHEVSAKIIFESLDGSVVDSTDMAKSPVTEGNQWQGKWKTPGPVENTYWLSVKVMDNADDTNFTNKHVTKITTVPLVIDSIASNALSDYRYTFKPYFKNAGTTQTITKIKVNLTSNDPWIKSIIPAQKDCSDLIPGKIKGLTSPFTLTYDSAASPSSLHFNLSFTISSDGWPYWIIDTTLTIATTGIEPDKSTPLAFSLNQNYPNPFNTVTTINWQIPGGTNASLKVFDVCGREVATLFDGYKPTGKYESSFSAEALPGGVYFYRLRAGEFSAVRKMLLLK